MVRCLVREVGYSRLNNEKRSYINDFSQWEVTFNYHAWKKRLSCLSDDVFKFKDCLKRIPCRSCTLEEELGSDYTDCSWRNLTGWAGILPLSGSKHSYLHGVFCLVWSIIQTFTFNANTDNKFKRKKNSACVKSLINYGITSIP